MQKKQQKNLKRNTGEIQRIYKDRREKRTKEYLLEKNYQGGLQQGDCLDGQIRNIMRNTGQDQKGIGDARREDKQEAKKCWRQLGRKKKKTSKKNQESRNGQKKKKKKKKWVTFVTHTMSFEESLR